MRRRRFCGADAHNEAIVEAAARGGADRVALSEISKPSISQLLLARSPAIYHHELSSIVDRRSVWSWPPRTSRRNKIVLVFPAPRRHLYTPTAGER